MTPADRMRAQADRIETAMMATPAHPQADRMNRPPMSPIIKADHTLTTWPLTHHWLVPHTPEIVLGDVYGRVGQGGTRYLRIGCTVCDAWALIFVGAIRRLLPPDTDGGTW